jgi:hypothetical protein
LITSPRLYLGLLVRIRRKFFDLLCCETHHVDCLCFFVDVRSIKFARPDDMRAHVDAAVQERTQFIANQPSQRQNQSRPRRS